MKLFYLNIHSLNGLEGLSLLSPERQERVLRYRQEADRLRSLGAGLLIRHALGEKQNHLLKGEHGKLYLPEGPFFNLSHSGDYVILGLSEKTIGVDIEQISPYSEKVAQRCYTEEEMNWLSRQQTDSAFYRLWTAKESIMKATGLGFQMSPESFSVLPIAPGPHIIKDQTWYLTWTVLPQHMICVATAREESLEMLAVTPQM